MVIVIRIFVFFLFQLGSVYLAMGDTQRAFESFQAHISLQLKSNSKVNESLSRAVCNMGKYHVLVRDYPRALPLFKAVLDSEEMTGKSKRTEARALHHLGE